MFDKAQTNKTRKLLTDCFVWSQEHYPQATKLGRVVESH
jgi:hypothetical protein